MSVENSSTFIGRMAAAPEPLGTTGVKFRLGVDVWDGQAKAKKTVWVPFVAWAKNADLVRQYVSVGRQIAVEAEYRPREYEHQGQKRLDPQFVVSEIKLLAESSKQPGQFAGSPTSGQFDDQTNDPGPSSPW